MNSSRQCGSISHRPSTPSSDRASNRPPRHRPPPANHRRVSIEPTNQIIRAVIETGRHNNNNNNNNNNSNNNRLQF